MGKAKSLPATDPLPGLAARINEAHDRCRAAMTDGVRHAVEAGKLLAEARENVRHGEWMPWLRANVTFSVRSAQAYMRLAENCRELDQPKAQRVALLPFRDALAELSEKRPAASAKEERAAAMEMSRHPVDELVKFIDRRESL